MSKNVLLTGATGAVGSLMTRALVNQKGLSLRVMTRDPNKAAGLEGAEVVRGAFEDKASLESAMKGIDTLALITAPGPHAADQAAVGIEVAKAAGVRRIVRLSALKAAIDGPTDNTRQHGRTEALLRSSGVRFVSLRPQFFMQNMLGLAGMIARDGKLFAGVGDGRIGMIDTRDVADAMVSAVLDDRRDSEAIELTGPASISHAEIAATLAKVLGRSVDYVAIPPSAAAEGVRAYGADDWTVQLLNDYFTAYSRGFGDFVTDEVQKITGHPARSFETFAKDIFVHAAKG